MSDPNITFALTSEIETPPVMKAGTSTDTGWDAPVLIIKASGDEYYVVKVVWPYIRAQAQAAGGDAWASFNQVSSLFTHAAGAVFDAKIVSQQDIAGLTHGMTN